eukprot:m.88081 g.88081  ORF g.88081 m.88081 type:complete len:270 (-) comp26152_c1_seq1:106-915(-)
MATPSSEIPTWIHADTEQNRIPDDATTPGCLHPPSTVFDLRNAEYLKEKKKTPAKPPIFGLVDLKPFAFAKNITHIAERLTPLKEFLASHPDREFFIVNRMLPTTPVLNVVTLFVRTETDKTADPPFELAFQRFKDANDEAKNLVFKYIVKIPNAPFALRMAVSALGGFRPVIMGKGYLQQHHFSGANYCEVDVDVGSSRVARGIMNVVVPQMKKLIVDEAFLIEGQHIDELPERLLGCSRGIKYDFKDRAITLDADMVVGAVDDDADE